MNAHQILVLDLFQKLKCLFPYYQHELRLIKQIRVRIKQSTEKWLIDILSKRLLGLEFKSNHSIKSKCLKWIVKNVLPTILGINYSQAHYFSWIHTIQSHIFLFFTDIPHIFFHPLIFLFLPNNCIKFFMTYFHVNQCLRYLKFQCYRVS